MQTTWLVDFSADCDIADTMYSTIPLQRFLYLEVGAIHSVRELTSLRVFSSRCCFVCAACSC